MRLFAVVIWFLLCLPKLAFMEFEMLQSKAPVTGYRIYNGEAKRRKKGKSIAVSLSQAD